jgi:hypothetical protein
VSDKSKASAGGGVGIGGLLTVAFVVMKLAGIGAVAHWSWWWVLAPAWISFAIVLVGVVVLVVGAVIVALLE